MSMLPELGYPEIDPFFLRFPGIARERRDEPVEDDDDLPPLVDDDDLPPLVDDDDLPPLVDDDDLPPLLEIIDPPLRFETCFICQIEKQVSAKIDFISDISDIYSATNAPQWVCESCRRDVYYRIDAYHRIHVHTPSSVEIIHDHDGGIDIDIYISRL